MEASDALQFEERRVEERRVEERRVEELRAAEAWFRRRGLPWFVEAVDERVRALLNRRWVWPLAVAVVAVAVGVGWLVDRAVEDPVAAVLATVLVALALLLAYAGGPLRVAVMARWATRRAVAELNLLLPLVTRALPLLLIFMTFLFVNTEVWQVTSVLPRTSLYAVVLLFSGVGVAFLLTRLPEEVREVQRAAAGEALVRACRGTPLAERAEGLAAAGEATVTPLSGTQRANLLLVLLVTQALQVLLLVVTVFAFFIGFGLLAIRPEVVRTWIGHDPNLIVWNWRVVVLHLPVSWELYQVAVFLSAFAGLYFTVYAVSDAGYRQQFFGELSAGMEQAIGVHAVYRALLDAEASPTSPGVPVTDDSVSDLGHW